MNTIKQITVGSLLLVTGATQAMSTTDLARSWANNIWSKRPTKESVLGHVKNAWMQAPSRQEIAAQATALAHNAWEKVPSKQTATNTVTTLAHSAWEKVPAKQEVVAQANRVVANVKDAAVNHPYITAAVAVAVPTIAVAEYALQKNALPTLEEYNQNQFFNKMETIINSLNNRAASILNTIQINQSGKNAERLGFEQSLPGYMNLIPAELSGELANAWNDFINAAIIYDRTDVIDDKETSLVVVECNYRKLHHELKKLMQVIVDSKNKTQFKPTISADALNKMVTVLSNKKVIGSSASIAVPVAAVATVHKIKPGLINESVKFVKNIDYKKAALKAKDAIVDQYTRYSPALGQAFDKTLTLVQNNKKVGALTACAVLGAGLGYKLHNYLTNDEVSFPEKK